MSRSASSSDGATVAVDVVPLAIREGRLTTAVVAVKGDVPDGLRAFPGGRVAAPESLDAAARRCLTGAVGDDAGAYLEQLYTFGAPSRDPRARVVSVAYLALLRSPLTETPETEWVDWEHLPSLAYDHEQVASLAIERLRAKLGYTTVAVALLPDEFTMGDMQATYEAILGRGLDRRNFRKRAEGLGVVERTGNSRSGPHRPAQLYRFCRSTPEALPAWGERR